MTNKHEKLIISPHECSGTSGYSNALLLEKLKEVEARLKAVEDRLYTIQHYQQEGWSI